ncbi:aminoacetone oxidase family FAD-binding enzyme [soil metagenome]
MTETSPPDRADIAVLGAGAAGLFAAIFAARTLRSAGSRARVVAVDGAKTLGAKILVAGGGRCNVTHHAVDASAYAGSSRNAIGKVLRRFDVPATIAFFAERGVELKREETGKLFPVTNKARDILDALLSAARDAGVEIWNPWRVGALSLAPDDHADARTPAPAFMLTRGAHLDPAPGPDASAPADDSAHAEEPIAPPRLHAARIIIATGGMALPKSGSDGAGYAFVRALGHTTTPRIVPALVPLILAESCFIRALSGITLPTTLRVVSGHGKRLVEFTNSTLCTHFGLSGPGPLDISRYYFAAKADDAAARLEISWTPGSTVEQIDDLLLKSRHLTPAAALARRPLALPERLALALCTSVGLDPAASGEHLPRDRRRALAAAVAAMPVPVVGERGFTYAEVTAGGVPLSEIRLETMESRARPGVHLCGEICDVDGRIGGFNFQWAWASGFAAGIGAAEATLSHAPSG